MKIAKGSIIFVAVNALKVREKPTISSAKIGLLKRGKRLVVREIAPGTPAGEAWVQVAEVSSSMSTVPLGWIAAQYGGKTMVSAKPVPAIVPSSELPTVPGVTEETLPAAPFIAGGILLVGIAAFLLLRKT